ncbi:hypothetical protein BsWGS_25623 [Bradybaena similaris]
MWAQEEEMNSIENGQHIVFVYNVVEGKFMFGRQTPSAKLPYVCEISLNEAYRIIQQERDHMFGTDIMDPNKVILGPKFIKQPNSIVVLPPLPTAVIECVVVSNPDASYKWYHDRGSSKMVEMTSTTWYTITNGKLTITNPDETRDEGSYQCVASNAIGSVLSDPVRISFGFLHEFSNHPPGGVTAKLYQGIAIACQLPAYNPAVAVKWYKEDDGPNFMRTDLHPYIFVSNNGKLYFSEISQMDAGEYHCFVTLMSPVGHMLSAAQYPARSSMGIQLVVTGDMAHDYGPEIHNDFPAVFPFPSLRGETLTLECFAFGKLPLYYSWSRDNGPIPEKASLMEHGRMLILPDAQLEDAGNYTCIVERQSNAVQVKSLHLIIEARPFFIFPLTDQHVDIDRQFTWRCEAMGIPRPTYTWFKDGKQLYTIPGDIEVQVSTLTILKTDPKKHPGMYQCMAVNVHGTSFSTAQLRVLSFAPSFLKRPVNPSQYGTVGGEVIILCQPESAPPATITWLKDDRELSEAEGAESRVTKLANGNLLLKGLQMTDTGTYTCVASNNMGNASSSGHLTIVTRSVISIPPSDIHVDINNTAFLSCQASYDQSKRDLVYVWDLNGRVLDFEREPHYMLGSKGVLSGLYIVSAQLYHTGLYRCSATTVDDTTTATAYVTVNGPPGECAGVRAAIAGRNSTIFWILGPDYGAPISLFHLQFNTNFNPEWRVLKSDVSVIDAIDVNFPNQRCLLTVYDLKPGSSYRFRVIAVNRYGQGPPSLPSVLYKIPDAAPVVPVDGIRAAWGPVGTLPVTWNPLHLEDLTGDGVGYMVYYRKKSATKSLFSTMRVDGRDTTITAVVGPDNYFLEYEIIVGAFNDHGYGPNSSIVVIMSAEDMPPAAPTKVYGDPYNATAMMVHWVPIPNNREFVRGNTIGYQINYWSQTVKNPEIGSTNIYCDCGIGMVVGLDPNEDYWINIQVFTNAGLGPVSGDGEGSTFIFPPMNYPEYVHVGSYMGNAVFVTWRGVSTGLLEEPVIGYKIRWWPATENIRKANDTVVPRAMSHGVVKGLENGVVYALRVLAYSAGGDGKKSPTTYFTLEGQVVYNPETTEIMNSSPLVTQQVFWAKLIVFYTLCSYFI